MINYGSIYRNTGITTGLVIAMALFSLAALLLFQLATLPEFSRLSVGPRFTRTIGWTTLQASLSTILSLLLGGGIAWALHHQPKFPGRSLFIALLSSAMVLPTLVVVLGLITVLGRNGWLNVALQAAFNKHTGSFVYGLDGILIAHCYFNASFAARSFLTRFDAIPNEQRKLCKSLGLGVWQRFSYSEWPAISAGIPQLATTIFLLCFTSFAIVLTLGGSPKYNTLEVSVYEAIKLDFNLGRALGLALVQLSICALLVAANSRFKTYDKSISPPIRQSHYHRDSWQLQSIQILLIAIFGAAFLLPLFAVVTDGIQANLPALLQDKNFKRAAITSISLALISSTVVLVISVLLTICHTSLVTHQRFGSRKLATFASRFITFSATLYLAVPAVVLGFGFFVLARNHGGSNILWASAALITANVLMTLPFALVVLTPAAVKAANRYNKLAASLGVHGLSRWRLVESTLLRSELAYVAAIAFCMSLGDLGIIALFGSQDFTTLPWLLYQKMGSYRTDEAAGIALLMLSLTFLVFLLIPKLMRSKYADS